MDKSGSSHFRDPSPLKSEVVLIEYLDYWQCCCHVWVLQDCLFQIVTELAELGRVSCGEKDIRYLVFGGRQLDCEQISNSQPKVHIKN